MSWETIDPNTEAEHVRRTSDLLSCWEDLWVTNLNLRPRSRTTHLTNKLYLLIDLILDGQAELGGGHLV